MTEKAEFLKLYLGAQPSLRAYLFSLLRDAHDVEDVHQEVSLGLWERFGSYDPRLPFLPWALGVARNHVARLRRRRARSWLTPDLEQKLAATAAELEEELSPRRSALRECIDKLGSRARELLALRYEKVWSLDRIAGSQASTVNAVNKSLGKIRLFLSECTSMTLARERGGP